MFKLIFYDVREEILSFLVISKTFKKFDTFFGYCTADLVNFRKTQNKNSKW